MRRVYFLPLIAVTIATLNSPLSAGAPTTINDFFLPGSQPGQSSDLKKFEDCDCHGDYEVNHQENYDLKTDRQTRNPAEEPEPDVGSDCTDEAWNVLQHGSSLRAAAN